MVRDLGNWRPDPYNDEEDDDPDRYVPDYETEEKLDEIVSKVKKMSGQHISWSPDEKIMVNYICRLREQYVKNFKNLQIFIKLKRDASS